MFRPTHIFSAQRQKICCLMRQLNVLLAKCQWLLHTYHLVFRWSKRSHNCFFSLKCKMAHWSQPKGNTGGDMVRDVLLQLDMETSWHGNGLRESRHTYDNVFNLKYDHNIAYHAIRAIGSGTGCVRVTAVVVEHRVVAVFLSSRSQHGL